MISSVTKLPIRQIFFFVCITLVYILIFALPGLVHAQSDDVGWMTRFGQFMGNILLNLASMFTWMGGSLLESSIQHFILNIGNNLGNASALGQIVGKLWVLVRDICNLVFIFGFIYIGIRTIIDADDSGTKRMLASLIIGALLINFSLFFTKVVIDISNYTAVEIYNATISGGTQTSTISAKFGEMLGIYAFYSKPPDGNVLANTTRGGAFAFYFMAALLLVVAGFVFAAGGLLLLIRFVALLFIMIFSPVLFAATVFPSTAHYALRLWKELISYSFFAPAYLLLLLISLKLVQGAVTVFNKTPNKGIADVLGSGNTDAYDVMLVFIIGIMVLIFSLKIAQSFGVIGAEKVMSAGKSVRNGITGFAGRNTIGRVGNWTSEKIGDAEKSTSSRTRATAKVLKYTGVNAAAGALAGAKYGGGVSRKEAYKAEKEHKKEHAETHEFVNFKTNVEEGIKNAGVDEEKQIKLERSVANASVKYLEELSQDERIAIVKHMTQSQFEGLEKSDKLNDTEKGKIAEERKKILEQIYQSEKEKLTRATVDQLNALGANYLAEEQHAVRLNSSQMDDLKKKLTATEYKKLSEARENALKSLAGGGSIDTTEKSGAVTLGREFVLNQKSGELSKMPADVLKLVSHQLPVAVLAKIAQEGTLNKRDQAEIKQKIIDEGFNDPNNAQIGDLLDFLDKNPIGRQFGT